jgi:hypothetical protein
MLESLTREVDVRQTCARRVDVFGTIRVLE